MIACTECNVLHRTKNALNVMASMDELRPQIIPYLKHMMALLRWTGTMLDFATANYSTAIRPLSRNVLTLLQPAPVLEPRAPAAPPAAPPVAPSVARGTKRNASEADIDDDLANLSDKELWLKRELLKLKLELTKSRAPVAPPAAPPPVARGTKRSALEADLDGLTDEQLLLMRDRIYIELELASRENNAKRQRLI